MQTVTKGFASGRKLAGKTWSRRRSAMMKARAHRASRRTGRLCVVTERSSS